MVTPEVARWWWHDEDKAGARCRRGSMERKWHPWLEGELRVEVEHSGEVENTSEEV